MYLHCVQFQDLISFIFYVKSNWKANLAARKNCQLKRNSRKKKNHKNSVTSMYFHVKLRNQDFFHNKLFSRDLDAAPPNQTIFYFTPRHKFITPCTLTTVAQI